MKKILSLVLSVLMVVSMLPMNVLATDSLDPAQVTVAEVDTEDALLAAVESGGNIVLKNDITVTSGITIDEGVEIDLDLAGCTISGSSSESEDYALITNLGKLTVKDSSAEQTGKISYEYVGESSNWTYAWGNYTIKNCGDLTVAGGTIENISKVSAHMFSAIDNHSGGVVTVNGGTVSCPEYVTIRLFAKNATDVNTVTINAGTVTGKWALWPQNASGNDETAAILAINGGTVTGTRSALYLEEPLGNISITKGDGVEISAPDGYSWINGTIVAVTESDIVITTADELKAFADAVNAGNTYAGETVKLGADIDLGDIENWQPIGTYTSDTTLAFQGTFDGQGYTVSNLNVNGDIVLGLFGFVANATIKNVNIDNATIVGNWEAGALVGLTNHSTVDNCHVSNVTVTITPRLVDGEYDDGNHAGGVVGLAGNSTVSNCSATDVAIKAYRDAGGVVGTIEGYTNAVYPEKFLGKVENCSAENVTITIDQITGYYADKAANAGYVVGRFSGDGASETGSTESGENSIVVLEAAAQIGNVKYATLAEAFAAAENGATVTLLCDIELSETITISEDDEIVLDLGGMTITATDAKATGDFYLFYNFGTLTVTGDGVIELTAQTDRSWNASSSIFHNRGGVLTIENGTFTHNGGTAMAYVVDNSGNSYGDAVANINGGTLTSTYVGIRNRMDTYGANGGGNGVATLNIAGGEITGKRAVWGQVASSGVQGAINVTGGTLTGAEGESALLVDTDDSGEIAVAVSGGTFSSTIDEAWLVENCGIVESNGMYVVDELPDATVTKLDPFTLTAAEHDYMVWPSGDATVDRPLNVVMNFKANDTLEEAQASAYGKFKVDFYLTFTGLADGTITADGCYLAGNYGSYGWIVIPTDGLELESDVSYPVVSAYDANLTYENICDYVKDFTAAIYVTPEILEANPDMEITLELKMVNPENENDVLVVGGYEYDVFDLGYIPEIPTATVTELENEDLTFAMNFKADTATAAQLAYYGNWYADYVLTINKDVTFNANGGADGWLSGQYDAWSENWVNVPFEDVTVTADEPLKIMEYAAELMGQSGLKLTYNDVYTSVKDFDCGVFFTDEFLAANPDLVVTLELRMFDPEDETKSYVIGETYEFKAADVSLGLKGSGTETDPFQIWTLDDLIFFRDSVNAGETTYNASGVYVQVMDDIDMASADWSVNIGDDCSVTFDGIFDGAGHTLSNLNSTETAAKGDGYICTGLFGAIYGDAVVKNLTIKNVSINTGDYVGNNISAVVGFAYSATGSVENVQVIGDININAPGATGVGAVVGYDYYGKLTVKDCVVDGNDGSAIVGKSYVGGVIGYASTNSTVDNCTVQDVAIDAAAAVGGVAGIALAGSEVTNATVKNVDITVTHENWQNSAAIAIGTITKYATASVTYEDVTVNGVSTDTVVGSESAEQPTTPVAKVVARVGDVYYVTLEAAIAAAAASEEADIVVLLAPITVASGETLTIDLKGQTVSYTSNVPGEDMITNNGTLTINDSVGGGKFTYANTDTTAANVTVSTITNNPGGVLTVNGGTVENTSSDANAWQDSGIYPFAIDNVTNGTLGAASTTINGGTIESTYRSIRMFANSTTDANTVTINGGEMVGQVWLQSSNSSAQNASLTITDGTFAPVGNDGSSVYINTNGTTTPAFSVTGGTFTTKIGTDSAANAATPGISGGTFTAAAKNGTNEELLADGYVFVENSDGTYGVEKEKEEIVNGGVVNYGTAVFKGTFKDVDYLDTELSRVLLLSYIDVATYRAVGEATGTNYGFEFKVGDNVITVYDKSGPSSETTAEGRVYSTPISGTTAILSAMIAVPATETSDIQYRAFAQDKNDTSKYYYSEWTGLIPDVESEYIVGELEADKSHVADGTMTIVPNDAIVYSLPASSYQKDGADIKRVLLITSLDLDVYKQWTKSGVASKGFIITITDPETGNVTETIVETGGKNFVTCTTTGGQHYYPADGCSLLDTYMIGIDASIDLSNVSYQYFVETTSNGVVTSAPIAIK